MKTQQKKAFTLVELIIVITILTILVTIGFMSFRSYTLDARDSKRVTDIKQVSNGLVIYKTKNIKYPSHNRNTTANIGDLIIQGYIDSKILGNIKMSNDTIDPLEKLPYTYSTNPDYTKYQLLTFLEDGTSYKLSASLNQAFANDYNSRQEYVIGDKLGIVLDNSSSAPIQEIQTGTIDLAGTYAGTQFKLIVDNTSSGTITSTGSSLVNTISTATNLSITQSTYDWYSSGSSWIFKDSNNNITYPTSCNNLITNNSLFHIASSLTASGAGFKDGIYSINPTGTSTGYFNAYCDMTNDGGGWTRCANMQSINTYNTYQQITTTNPFIFPNTTIINNNYDFCNYSSGDTYKFNLDGINYLSFQVVTTPSSFVNSSVDIKPNISISYVNNSALNLDGGIAKFIVDKKSAYKGYELDSVNQYGCTTTYTNYFSVNKWNIGYTIAKNYIGGTRYHSCNAAPEKTASSFGLLEIFVK